MGRGPGDRLLAIRLVLQRQLRYTKALYDLHAFVLRGEPRERGGRRTAVHTTDSNRLSCFIERDRNIVSMLGGIQTAAARTQKPITCCWWMGPARGSGLEGRGEGQRRDGVRSNKNRVCRKSGRARSKSGFHARK
jgi:hypothetical protein